MQSAAMSPDLKPARPAVPSHRLRAAFCAIAAAWLAGQAAAQTSDAGVEKVVVKAVAHFDFATAALKPDDAGALLGEVGKLKDVSWQSVTATGHTDDRGRDSVNQRLSQRRADAVRSYLVSQGIGASMIRTRGLASRQPVAPNDSAAGRAENRRTEVEFQGVRSAAK